MTQHQGLPVAGYQPQSDRNIERVNTFKRKEEEILRLIDELRLDMKVDTRWLAIGTTQLEQAFMALNRSIFNPTRITI